jgi:hypothetical protein
VRSVLFRAWYRDKIARLTAFRATHKHFETPIGGHDIPLSQGRVARGALYRLLFPIARRERVPLPTTRTCDEVVAPTTRLVHPLAPLFSRQVRVSRIRRLLPWATDRSCEEANEKQSCDRSVHLPQPGQVRSPNWASNRRAGLTRQDRTVKRVSSTRRRRLPFPWRQVDRCWPVARNAQLATS